MTPKNWFLSKTIWVAVLTALLPFIDTLQANLRAVDPIFTTETSIKVFATVIAVVNIFLRLITTKPIKM